jgi:hypothetical protein
MGTKHASKANEDITFLAVGLASLTGVNLALRKILLFILERDDVMRQRVQLLHVLIDTIST